MLSQSGETSLQEYKQVVALDVSDISLSEGDLQTTLDLSAVGTGFDDGCIFVYLFHCHHAPCV